MDPYTQHQIDYAKNPQQQALITQHQMNYGSVPTQGGFVPVGIPTSPVATAPTSPVVQVAPQGPQTIQLNVCVQQAQMQNSVAASNRFTDELEYEAFEERFEETKNNSGRNCIIGISLMFLVVVLCGILYNDKKHLARCFSGSGNNSLNNNIGNYNDYSSGTTTNTSPSYNTGRTSSSSSSSSNSQSSTSTTNDENEVEPDTDNSDDGTDTTKSRCAKLFPCCSFLGCGSSANSDPEDNESVKVKFEELDEDGTSAGYVSSMSRGEVIMEFGETLYDLINEIRRQSGNSYLYVDHLEASTKLTKLRINRDGNKTLRANGFTKNSTIYLFKSSGNSRSGIISNGAAAIGTAMKLEIRVLNGEGSYSYSNGDKTKKLVIEQNASIQDLAEEINSRGNTRWYIDHFELRKTYDPVFYKIRYENKALMATKLSEYEGLTNGYVYCFENTKSIRGWTAGVIENGVENKCIQLTVNLLVNGQKVYGESNKKLVIELGATVGDLQTEIRGRLSDAGYWNISYFKLPGYNEDIKKVIFDRCKDQTLESFGLKKGTEVFCTK